MFGSAVSGWIGFSARFIVVVGTVFALHLGIESLLNWAENNSVSLEMKTTLIVMFVVIYALAISVPFVPGVEIGLSLLVLRGAEIAPWLYLATVFGLGLAFLVGHTMPDQRLIRFLRNVRLDRMAAKLSEISPLSAESRLAQLRRRLPAWLSPMVVEHRYVLVALLFNLPGNMALGGGGGIALAAGLSRLFHPAPFLLAVAIAVLPVPLLVWLMGPAALPL